MAFESTFETIALGDLLNVTRAKHDAGYRFVQMLCAMTDDGVDLVYSFMGQSDTGEWLLENYKICNFNRETQTVPSVTGYYLSAFPFENEAHDLFGVKVEGNAIDFAGRFYQVSMDTPMTVVSPEQKAAREKAARVAAAKAAKEAKGKAEASQKAEASGSSAPSSQSEASSKSCDAGKISSATSASDDIEAKRAQMEERLAGMDPEKAAKVRAAFEAKLARDAAQKGGE